MNGLPFLGLVGLGRHPGSDPPNRILAALTTLGFPSLASGVICRVDIILAAMPAFLPKDGPGKKAFHLAHGIRTDILKTLNNGPEGIPQFSL